MFFSLVFEDIDKHTPTGSCGNTSTSTTDYANFYDNHYSVLFHSNSSGAVFSNNEIEMNVAAEPFGEMDVNDINLNPRADSNFDGAINAQVWKVTVPVALTINTWTDDTPIIITATVFDSPGTLHTNDTGNAKDNNLIITWTINKLADPVPMALQRHTVSPIDGQWATSLDQDTNSDIPIDFWYKCLPSITPLYYEGQIITEYLSAPLPTLSSNPATALIDLESVNQEWKNLNNLSSLSEITAAIFYTPTAHSFIITNTNLNSFGLNSASTTHDVFLDSHHGAALKKDAEEQYIAYKAFNYGTANDNYPDGYGYIPYKQSFIGYYTMQDYKNINNAVLHNSSNGNNSAVIAHKYKIKKEPPLGIEEGFLAIIKIMFLKYHNL